jgi:hypothetical protein
MAASRVRTRVPFWWTYGRDATFFTDANEKLKKTFGFYETTPRAVTESEILPAFQDIKILVGMHENHKKDFVEEFPTKYNVGEVEFFDRIRKLQNALRDGTCEAIKDRLEAWSIHYQSDTLIAEEVYRRFPHQDRDSEEAWETARSLWTKFQTPSEIRRQSLADTAEDRLCLLEKADSLEQKARELLIQKTQERLELLEQGVF